MKVDRSRWLTVPSSLRTRLGGGDDGRHGGGRVGSEDSSSSSRPEASPTAGNPLIELPNATTPVSRARSMKQVATKPGIAPVWPTRVPEPPDRKSGVEGKRVAVRVDPGGGRSIKKKK